MHCVIIYFTEMTVVGYCFSPGSVSDKQSFAYSPDCTETTAERLCCLFKAHAYHCFHPGLQPVFDVQSVRELTITIQ